MLLVAAGRHLMSSMRDDRRDRDYAPENIDASLSRLPAMIAICAYAPEAAFRLGALV